MTAVLIAYDLSKPGQKYEALHEKIKAYGIWSHSLESTWIVSKKGITAQSVYDDLKNELDSNDRIFCVEIDGKPRTGWLRKATWAWIKAHV